MNIVICDSNKTYCAMLEKWIHRFRVKECVNIIVEVFYDENVLIKKIEDDYFFDMIFLNIGLSQKTGLELGYVIRKKFADKEISIVLISEDKTYDDGIFDLEPQNFHRKPLNESRIISDIKKCLQRNKNSRGIFKYKEEGVPKGISIGEIAYIEAKEKGLEIAKSNGSKIFVKESIINIEGKFEKYYLFRCHKSFMVNAKYIKKYHGQSFFMKDGVEIAIGRKYVSDVKRLLHKYGEEMV